MGRKQYAQPVKANEPKQPIRYVSLLKHDASEGE